MQSNALYGPDGSSRRDRFAEGYDESMEQTIRPNRCNRQNRSLMASFDIQQPTSQSPQTEPRFETQTLSNGGFDQLLPAYDPQAASWQNGVSVTRAASRASHRGHRRGKSMAGSQGQVHIRPRPSPTNSVPGVAMGRRPDQMNNAAFTGNVAYAMGTPITAQGSQFSHPSVAGFVMQTPPMMGQGQLSMASPFSGSPVSATFSNQYSNSMLSPATTFHELSPYLDINALSSDMIDSTTQLNCDQSSVASALLPPAEMRPTELTGSSAMSGAEMSNMEQLPQTPHTPESARSEASVHGYDELDIDWSQAPALPRMIETGITEDQINEHMEAPEENGGKWRCKFEDCTRTFGRKENIRSHVQTHLNDRRFGCRLCDKDHVRSHDHKRHYLTTHTQQKPFMCPCKQRFGRLDALKRHRSRGLCPGAYDGVKRTPAKRGRPRKDRPDMAERTAKSKKTRQKNMSISSMSSFTSSSEVASPGIESPYVGSPEMDWDRDTPASQHLMSESDFSGFTTVPMSMSHPFTAPMPGAGQTSSSSSHTVTNTFINGSNGNNLNNMANQSHIPASSPQAHVSPVELERSSSQMSFASAAESHSSSSTSYESLFSEPLDEYLTYTSGEMQSLDGLGVGGDAGGSTIRGNPGIYQGEGQKFYTEEEFDREIDNLFFSNE